MGRRRTRRKKQRGGAPSASPAFKHYIPEPAFPPGGSYKVGCPTRKNGYYYQFFGRGYRIVSQNATYQIHILFYFTKAGY